MTFDQWLDKPISGTTRRAYYSDNQLTAARDAWEAATSAPPEFELIGTAFNTGRGTGPLLLALTGHYANQMKHRQPLWERLGDLYLRAIRSGGKNERQSSV